MKLLKKSVFVPVAAVAAVVMTATSATAGSWQDYRSTEGAAASCNTWTTTTNTTDDTAHIRCSIQDSLDDRKSVYVDWWVGGYPKRRLSNTGGYGASVTREDSYRSDSSNSINWAVCRLNTFGDNCSSVVSHHP